jgi:hypothetical protein
MGTGTGGFAAGDTPGPSFRPSTAPGFGSVANLPLAKRRPVTYQKKLGPYRDLGVDSKHAETEMADWAHEHDTDVNVEQCESDSHRTVNNLRLESGSLTHAIRERTALFHTLKEELSSLDDALADPALAERIALMEGGEQETLHNTAEVEVEVKGYELMMKREVGNLDAANDKLVELQARIKRADEELGEAKIRRCRLTASKTVLKAPMVSALETRI